MAELWLATDTERSESVVIKKILPHLATDPRFLKMFLDEARIAAQLHHPNVVQIHDLGKLNGSIYIVMEYVEGLDLRQLMSAEAAHGRSIPYPMAAYLISKVCAGLSYAHNAKGVDGHPLGIIHRDISPQNVMIGKDGRVKLVDFGIAKAGALMEISHPGMIKGKYFYLSPEQLGAARVDHRSDLFAVGTVLYEMTVGHPPFFNPSTEAVIMAIRSDPPVKPTRVKPDYPPVLSKIVMHCLAKDRDNRYQQGFEIQKDLEDYLTSQPQVTREDLGKYVTECLEGGDRERPRPTNLTFAGQFNAVPLISPTEALFRRVIVALGLTLFVLLMILWFKI